MRRVEARGELFSSSIDFGMGGRSWRQWALSSSLCLWQWTPSPSKFSATHLSPISQLATSGQFSRRCHLGTRQEMYLLGSPNIVIQVCSFPNRSYAIKTTDREQHPHCHWPLERQSTTASSAWGLQNRLSTSTARLETALLINPIPLAFAVLVATLQPKSPRSTTTYPLPKPLVELIAPIISLAT